MEFGLSSDVPLRHGQYEEDDAEPNAGFVDHFFCAASLYEGRSGSAEGRAEAGSPVLHENREDQENADDDFENGEDSHVNRIQERGGRDREKNPRS